jgi:flagellar hook-length control protein FliK
LSPATSDLRTLADTKPALPQATPDGSSASTNAAAPHQPQPGLPDTTTATLATPPVAPERVPTPDHVGLPPAVDASSPIHIQPHAQQGSSSQSGDSGDAHQHRSNRTISAVDAGAADQVAQVGNDQAFNAAMTQASAPASAPVEPAPVQPAQVVSQIVHQAELYRLPGNRGVRIQLHPEDLGGVQVTVRYAAGGGLELHINVEHAATGALVQAGWSELRDALATQGISPDRLVMSVTGPDSANQLDFSSNGGGSYRSDSGLAQFGQGGQSDRQHPDGGDDGRFSRAWSGRLESTSSTDDPPRVATSGAASRIDYRA